MTAEHPLLDVTLGVSAVTMPWWLTLIERGAHWYILVGGVVLITLRCLVARREWWKGK